MAGKKGRSGRLVKHGAFIIKFTDKDPRPEIRKWLNIDKEIIINDLGGLKNISGKQQLQVNNALRILNILYHFDTYLSENGIFKSNKGDYQPLINVYLSHVNSLSRILQSLGLEKVAKKEGMRLDQYIDAIKSKGKSDNK